MMIVMSTYELGFLFFVTISLLLTASALDTGVKQGDERSSSAELDFLCGYGVHFMIS